MPCPNCAGGANVFGDKAARSELKSYRKKGPSKYTRMLIEALRREGVQGLTLLDIGGGVGAISMELLKSGVSAATQVDASPAYVAASTEEATREGVSERFAARQGDFVALAPETPQVGIVTLDKVICCYPDMRALVSQSAAKAHHLYGAIYPRDVWWVRSIGVVGNALLRLFRQPLRLYVHDSASVDSIIREQGLSPRSQRNTAYWQVVVYGRPA